MQHQISYTIQISLTIWVINSYFVYSVQIQKSWNLNWSLINLNICKHREDNKKMKSTSGFVKYTSNRKLLNGGNNPKSYTRYNLNQPVYICLCVCVCVWISKQMLFVFPFFPLEMTCGGHSKGNIWWVFLRHICSICFDVKYFLKNIFSFYRVYFAVKYFQST